jgi:hypothetical protein
MITNLEDVFSLPLGLLLICLLITRDNERVCVSVHEEEGNKK